MARETGPQRDGKRESGKESAAEKPECLCLSSNFFKTFLPQRHGKGGSRRDFLDRPHPVLPAEPPPSSETRCSPPAMCASVVWDR